jgi:hypothetical protein
MIESIGSHRVRHGDVMDRIGIADLMGGQGAHIMYSDPPWGSGNLKYWSTMNRKMTGAEIPAPELDEFLDQIFEIASRHVSHYLLIEYGVRWASEILDRAKRAGFRYLCTTETRYRAGSKMLPLHSHAFVRTSVDLVLPEGYSGNLRDRHGYDCVKATVGPLVEQLRPLVGTPILLDPCCGMGYAAQAAIDFGAIFRGNEINRARLDKTIARLQRAT